MSDNNKQTLNTQAESEELDESSRSPGVTDRGLTRQKKPSKTKDAEQPTEKSQTKSESEDKD